MEAVALILLDYFDLNKQTVKPRFVETKRDIRAKTKKSVRKEAVKAEQAKMAWWEQLLMYVGIFAGVLLSSALKGFAEGKETGIHLNGYTIIFSAIVSLILMPFVYRKLKVDKEMPFVIRFGLFMQNGVFWQVILGAIWGALKK